MSARPVRQCRYLTRSDCHDAHGVSFQWRHEYHVRDAPLRGSGPLSGYDLAESVGTGRATILLEPVSGAVLISMNGSGMLP